jgi:hypothetical protein
MTILPIQITIAHFFKANSILRYFQRFSPLIRKPTKHADRVKKQHLDHKEVIDLLISFLKSHNNQIDSEKLASMLKKETDLTWGSVVPSPGPFRSFLRMFPDIFKIEKQPGRFFTDKIFCNKFTLKNISTFPPA